MRHWTATRPLVRILCSLSRACGPYSGPRRAERAKRHWQPAEGLRQGISRNGAPGWFTRSMIAAALLSVAPIPAAAQVSALPRMPDGKPNLQGLWQVLSPAAWDIQDHQARLGVPAGQGVVDGNDIPYQPWALAKKRENFANRLTADPETKGFLPGVPRIMGRSSWCVTSFRSSARRMAQSHASAPCAPRPIREHTSLQGFPIQLDSVSPNGRRTAIARLFHRIIRSSSVTKTNVSVWFTMAANFWRSRSSTRR